MVAVDKVIRDPRELALHSDQNNVKYLRIKMTSLQGIEGFSYIIMFIKKSFDTVEKTHKLHIFYLSMWLIIKKEKNCYVINLYIVLIK